VTIHRADIDEIRGFFAASVTGAAHCTDPRIERAFGFVPREAFLPPGPWDLMIGGSYLRSPSADPAYLYRNVLVGLVPERRLNNGEPVLHASWMQAVEPRPGERICHIGAGTGYYTAILSMLVVPGGTVTAFEIEPALAQRAKSALDPYEGVVVVPANALDVDLPASDVIYVNASLAAPPLPWLEALAPGGRMIFPWRPSDEVALALIVTRSTTGFSVKVLARAWFIPCTGTGAVAPPVRQPSGDQAASVRSLWRTGDRAPDETAIAIFQDVWFSSEPLPR
jgi:protein-L-isoaspartate(D-aspartate) O-methyltransferase